MTSSPSVVRGTNDKPEASRSLIEAFNGLDGFGGQLFVGYPVIGSADGRLQRRKQRSVISVAGHPPADPSR